MTMRIVEELGVCRSNYLPSELNESCKRLKSEELGTERYFSLGCEEIAGILKSDGAYERFPFTADSDLDLIQPLHDGTQFHYRLREVERKGCLVTVHREPDDPTWHLICGMADKLMGDNKPEFCKVDYSEDELQKVENFAKTIFSHPTY